MSAMTDPMDAPRSFQLACRSSQFAVQKDAKGNHVGDVGMAELIEGEPCFAIGYAVPDDQRGHGLSSSLAKSAIAELSHRLARYDISGFSVEAVVGMNNAA